MKTQASLLVTLLVAVAGLLVTAWKGPSAWSAVAATVTAFCIFVTPLLARAAETNPKIAKLEEYVADLEDELESVPGAETSLAKLKAKHGRPL